MKFASNIDNLRPILLILIPVVLFSVNEMTAQVIPVSIIRNEDQSFTLLRNGEPYYVKGAGTTNKTLLDDLVLRGGNSIRTWGVDAMSLSLLNEAHDKGISVMLGLWMKKEQDGFDYDDSLKVKEQLEKFRSFVIQFRNHPALLAWSIGNEVDAGYTNLNVWNAVNDISEMIHEEDGNHPTMTVIICANKDKVNAIVERAPDLDMLGINAYACISNVHNSILASNWDKPYMITEWGVSGPWEVSKTNWGAPLEATSTQKKELFIQRYQNYIEPNQNLIPGSYAFYWDSKFEATYTWFGLFVKDESTEMVDGMEYLWTGNWPENRAPEISSVQINEKSQNQNLTITAMSGNSVQVVTVDPEEDTLSFEYLVIPESGDYLVETITGATYRAIPGIASEQGKPHTTLNFKDIHNHLNMRLYVLIRDGESHIATATFPFQTNFSTLNQVAYTGRTDKPVFYPNPFTNTLNIRTNDESYMLQYQILNLKGQILFEKQITSGASSSIDLSSLEEGFYILKYSLNNGKPDYLRIFKTSFLR